MPLTSPVATFSSPNILNISPGGNGVGTYSITLQISDGINTPRFILSVKVTANTLPTFLTTPIAQSTPAGVPITYNLPSC
jgi:hypothetical protein